MCSVFIYTPPFDAVAPPDDASPAYHIHPHVLAAMRARSAPLEDARFVYYNFSLTFRGRNRYAAFDHLLEATKRFAPRPVVATYFITHSRIRGDRPSRIPGVYWLFEMEARGNIIAPFHLPPPTLAFAPAPPTAAPKKTLFFCGHVPKLYISSVRFQLWAQLVRRRDRATVCSHSLIRQGPYADCHHPGAWGELQRALDFTLPDRRPTPLHRCDVYERHGFYEAIRGAGRAVLPRALNASAFFALEMEHDFCIVAPGDYPSTPKIGETLVASALGGCIPVLIRPAARAIPYYNEYLECAVRWDSLNASALLAHLDGVTLPARRRLRACAARLAPRFLYQPAGGLEGKAGEALLRGLCARFEVRNSTGGA